MLIENPLSRNYAATAKARLPAAAPQVPNTERREIAGVSQTPVGDRLSMKLFSCQGCGQLLYFENVRCENCGRALGYLADLTEISAVEEKEDGSWQVLAAQGIDYKFCKNYN